MANILSKQEYCGDTVNFRSTTKSFKNKKKQLAAKRQKLSKAKKRIAEIDALTQKIYEHNKEKTA